MVKFMSPDEVRALYSDWSGVPGNGASLEHGLRTWIVHQLGDQLPLLITGASAHYTLSAQPGLKEELLTAYNGDERAALALWMRAIYKVLLELATVGWGVVPPCEDETAWTIGFYVFGPCARHGQPVDPVVGGCERCFAELPPIDPEAILVVRQIDRQLH